ncbi:MAG: Ser-Thr-rich GPI-anchored membrane family protein [Deltaproteobacteria bacterium]
MTCTRTAWLLAAAVMMPRIAAAHGGAEAAAFILDPVTHDVVVDDAYTFTWTDFDTDGEGGVAFQDFYFTTERPPPWPIWSGPAFLEGAPIAADIRLADTTNQLTWDTSTVAAGAYWLWSIARDPDILNDATTIRFSPFPVSVAHAGDEVAPSVVLTSPADAFDIADDTYAITWSAFDPDGSATVTLEAGTSTDGSALDVITTEVAAADGSYAWDTSALPEGDYLLRIRLEDARGMTFTAYAPNLLLVAHRTIPRDGGVATPDAGFADAGATTPAPTPEEPDGCRCAGTNGPRGRWAWLIFGALALLTRRHSTGRTRSVPTSFASGTTED